MTWQRRFFWNWLLPASLSALIGVMLLTTMNWAAVRTDAVASQRQRDLLNLIVSKLEASVAHDQESATVWDDAVIKSQARDLSWLDLNLGAWMNSYFGHDAAVLISPTNQPFYQFVADAKNSPSPEDLQKAYTPLVERLRERLVAGDNAGISHRVLSIGESDIRNVGKRPAIVSVKPIVSDTGDISQRAGQENIHVAVRYLDGDLPSTIAREYQFDEMKFTRDLPEDDTRSHVSLESKAGEVIGYFTWHPFKPGLSVQKSTFPVIGFCVIGVFGAASLAGHAISRRSLKLASSRQQLRHLALHDPLTGLANRRHFKQELSAHVRRALPGNIYSVLFVDLDRFKAVNDNYGHPTGDKLIGLVARRLRNALPHALIGRIGGDEFTILLDEPNVETVEAIAEQLVICLRQPFQIDGTNVSMTASVGVATAKVDTDAAELTRQADIALYHAKAGGRNTYAVFGKHMDELLRQRRKLEADLRVALETGTQIMTLYQPVYPAADTVPCSVEALSRWRHPEIGLVPPDIFIPLAEEIGCIHEIGAIVLEDACGLAARLPQITVAVNASPGELGASGYSLRVLSTLAKWGVEPKRLEIEITENLGIKAREQTALNIKTLRSAGVRFAIDDFGTGHSSFSRLQDVTADRIKIDKSFVQGVHEGRGKAVVEAMINMARAHGLRTTAEGVETDEQRVILQSLGCDNLQGFLMSRPLSRPDVIDIFAKKGNQVRSI